MDELVEKLRTDQPVEVRTGPGPAVASFKEALDRRFVLIKFTETRGGTELSVTLDEAQLDLSQANFEAGTGSVSLVGTLTLNYVPARCFARIDLASMKGTGRLEPRETQ